MKRRNAQFATSDALAFKHYLDSLELRKRGLWRDAGDKLAKTAEVFLKLKLVEEAAGVFCEAADCYERVDKGEAFRALALAAKHNSDAGRFDVAARLERRVARTHAKNKHWDDAALHFRRAANFFSGNQEVDASDVCLAHCADCLVRDGDLRAAHEAFETVAASCVSSNLRRFHARRFLLKAALCLFGMGIDDFRDNRTPQTMLATQANAQTSVDIINNSNNVNNNNNNANNTSKTATLDAQTLAQMPSSSAGNARRQSVRTTTTDDDSASVATATTATTAASSLAQHDGVDHVEVFILSCARRKPKYDEIASKLEEYDGVDFLWKESKEKRFLKNLLRWRLEANKDEFVDHVYFWNSVRPLDIPSSLALEPVVAEIEREAAEKINHDLTLEGRRVGGRKKRTKSVSSL